MRVTEAVLRSWLNWARNYGEIESFRSIAPRGRRWLIHVHSGITHNGYPLSDGLMGHRAENVVTERLLFTSREAMAFAMGCAVGGAARARGEWTQEDWDRRAERERAAHDRAYRKEGVTDGR